MIWLRGTGGRIACGLAPGGGQNAWRPRAWPLARESCSCRPRRLGYGRVGGWPGQAADLPVAQAVVDQGEQPAGGGDLGDVAGFLAAAGDDGVPGRADHAVAGDALDGLDQRPAQQPRALLGDVPAGDLDAGYLKLLQMRPRRLPRAG